LRAKPVPKIPAGNAKMETPISEQTQAKNLPVDVSGTMSPYPMVHSVMTAHHMDEARLLNFGFMSFSTKYITNEINISARNPM